MWTYNGVTVETLSEAVDASKIGLELVEVAAHCGIGLHLLDGILVEQYANNKR